MPNVALDWVEYSARVSRMLVKRGDPDIYSKDGRRTGYRIEVSAPTVTHNLVIHSAVTYDVWEDHHDWTWLKGTTEVRIPIRMHGSTALVNAFLEDRVTVRHFEDYVQAGTIHGENHAWLTLTPASCPYVGRIQFRIDGPGNDDHGNARLRVDFKVPFSYQT